MAVFYSDTFTAAGGAGGPPPTIPLSSHVSDSGHSYTTSSAESPKVDTDSDRLTSTTNGNARQFWACSAVPASADYRVSLGVTVLSTVDFTLCGPGARVQGAGLNTGYFAIIDPNLDQLQIAKYVSGTETIIGTPYTIGLGVLPETHKVTIEVSGTTIKAYLNDVERISVTDSAITATGNPGGVLRINANFAHLVADNATAETLTTGPSITAADNITDETQPATVTLANNTAAPTAITINGAAATGITDQGAGVYIYTPPLIADDATATLAVTVDGQTLTITRSYSNSYPYTLVTHGTPNANSIFVGTQFATNGPVEWGVVTDYNNAVVIVDHAAMDVAEDELNDVALHSTEVAAGTTTATYKYFVPESGATGTWQSEITVTDGVTPPIDVPVIGEPSQRRVGYRNSNRSAVRSSVGSSIH